MKSFSLIFLFLLFIISLSLNLTLVSSQKPTITDTNFIKRCCATTTYTKLCYATLLGSAAQIHSNPKSMAAKSLEVAHNEAQYVAQISARLAKMRGVDKREKAVLLDCTMAAGNSAAQLERSMQRMSGAAAAWTQMERSDVETWTSTAMTYATTCLEGLEGANNDMNEKVKKIVESKTVKLTQLTSNALALIKRYYVVSAPAHRNHHTNLP